MLIDYHTHPMAHGEREQTEENLLAFLRQAKVMGVVDLGVSDHDWYWQQYHFPILLRLQQQWQSQGVNLRIGIEIDHKLDRSQIIDQIIANPNYDYIIGSVHHLGDWEFDNEEFMEKYEHQNINDLYGQYFALVKNAVLTGKYNVLGHLDLIKVFGFRQEGDILNTMGDLFSCLAKQEVAVEINTNGLYKPIGEIYPQRKILEQLFIHNIPLTLGSDAHIAENVGRDLAQAVELAKKIGYNKIACFQKRKMFCLPL